MSTTSSWTPSSFYVLCALLFWFAGSIANNMWTKLAMKAFPYPLTVAYVGLLVQFLAGYMQRIIWGAKVTNSTKTLPWVRHAHLLGQ